MGWRANHGLVSAKNKTEGIDDLLENIAVAEGYG